MKEKPWCVLLQLVHNERWAAIVFFNNSTRIYIVQNWQTFLGPVWHSIIKFPVTKNLKFEVSRRNMHFCYTLLKGKYMLRDKVTPNFQASTCLVTKSSYFYIHYIVTHTQNKHKNVHLKSTKIWEIRNPWGWHAVYLHCNFNDCPSSDFNCPHVTIAFYTFWNALKCCCFSRSIFQKC